MARSLKLRWLLWRCLFVFIVYTLNSNAQISDLRLCADPECKEIVSIGRTLLQYRSPYPPLILSFKRDAEVKIFSKSAGSKEDLWGGEIHGKRGYFPKNFISEQRVLIKQLKHTVPTELKTVVSNHEDKKLDEDKKVKEDLKPQEDKQIQGDKSPPGDKQTQDDKQVDLVANSTEKLIDSGAENISNVEPVKQSSHDFSEPTLSTDNIVENNSTVELVKQSSDDSSESVSPTDTVVEISSTVESVKQNSDDPSEYISSTDSVVATSSTIESVKESNDDSESISLTDSVVQSSSTVESVTESNDDDSSESTSSPYSLVQNAWNKIKTAKLVTASLDGIQSVAAFTNEFPKSLDTLSDNLLRNFFTSAQQVPVPTPVPHIPEEKSYSAFSSRTTVDESMIVDTQKSQTFQESIDPSLSETVTSSLLVVESSYPKVTPSLSENVKEKIENSMHVEQEEFENNTQIESSKTEQFVDKTDTKMIDLVTSDSTNEVNSIAENTEIVDEKSKEILLGDSLDKTNVNSNIEGRDEVEENSTLITKEENQLNQNPSNETNGKNSDEQQISKSTDTVGEISNENEALEEQKSLNDVNDKSQSRVDENEYKWDVFKSVSDDVSTKADDVPTKVDGKTTKSDDITTQAGDVSTQDSEDDEEDEEDEDGESQSVDEDEEDDSSYDDDDYEESLSSTQTEIAYGDETTQITSEYDENNSQNVLKENTENTRNINPTPSFPPNTESIPTSQIQTDIKLSAGKIFDPSEKTFTPEHDDESVDLNTNRPSVASEISQSVLDDFQQGKHSDDLETTFESDQIKDQAKENDKQTQVDNSDLIDNSSWNLNEFAQPYLEATGMFMELIVDFLPEPIKVTLDEQKEKVSARVTVFTSITGCVLVGIFTVYLIFSRKAKEDKLILKLCQSDKKLFELTAERDILKEESLSARETITQLETDLSNSQEINITTEEELDNFRKENLELNSIVTSLKRELKTLQNCAKDLNSDVEERAKQQSELEEQYDFAVDKCQKFETRLVELEDDIATKQAIMVENENQISQLKQEITEVKESNEQLLQEARVWNERVQELQSQVEVATQTNDHIGSQLVNKQKEVELLEETIKQLELLQLDNDDESRSEKLCRLMDVSSVTNELNTVTRAKQDLQEELNKTMDKCNLLQVRLDELSSDNDTLKERDQQLKQERDEAVTKLQVLSDYFKEKEIELQRKLGFQEAKRQQTEESAESINEKAALYEREVILHKTHVESLKKELENQARSYKTQIAQNENKAHDNWLAARAAERKAEEAKQEAAMLRNKLTLLEQEKEAFSRAQGDGLNHSSPLRTKDEFGRIFAGSNGEIENDAGDLYPSPLDLSRRLPFLPLDRPLPPPPLHIPPPPPFERLPMPPFDMMPPFDPRLPFPPPPLGPHMSDSRLPSSPPLDRRLTPPRDFRSGGPMGRRPPSPPSFMRRPPSGRRTSPPRMPGDRFHDSGELVHQPSPPRFFERRTPPKFTEMPPDKSMSPGIVFPRDKPKPPQNDGTSV